MVGDDLDKIVIWPAFIDSELTRREGRRLPRKLSVKTPKVDEMLQAAEKLGYDPSIEDMAFPRRWHVEKKALVLGAKVPRSEALLRIAEELRRTRSH
jgi:signal recognition particle subunit SRP19